MKRIDFENDTVTKNIINAAFPLLVAQIMVCYITLWTVSILLEFLVLEHTHWVQLAYVFL